MAEGVIGSAAWQYTGWLQQETTIMVIGFGIAGVRQPQLHCQWWELANVHTS